MKLLEKIKNAKSNKKKTRFILSLIGSILYNVIYIIFNGIGGFSVYITSYFHHNNISVDMQYSNLIMPIVALCNSLSTPFSGFFVNKIGMRLTLILSFVLVELEVLLFINQMSISLSITIIVLIGISSGLGAPIPLTNLLFYYPQKKGIIGASIGSSFMIMGIVTSVIGEKVINPEKYILEKGEMFYPLEISKNYLKYFKYVLIINPILLVLSLLLIKKYDHELDEELLKENENTNNEIEEKKNIKIKKNKNYFKNMNSVILNKRIWLLISISCLSSFVSLFSKNTFRVYGALCSFNGTVMQYNQLIISCSYILVSPIWGYIVDKYKYKTLMKIICSSFILEALFFSIFIKNNIIYILCIVFGSLLDSGLINVTKTHFYDVYGLEYILEISGIVGIFVSIFNNLNSLISFIISKYYHTGEELQFAYRFVYISGIVITTLGFYLIFFEKEDKFIYPYPIKGDEDLNIINKDFIEMKRRETIKNQKEFELELESNSSDITVDSA